MTFQHGRRLAGGGRGELDVRFENLQLVWISTQAFICDLDLWTTNFNINFFRLSPSTNNININILNHHFTVESYLHYGARIG